MNVLNYILLTVLFLSGIITIFLVLAHNGKGTGVSEMIASSVYNASAGSGILNRNLDILTIVFVAIFMICAVLMVFTFPLASLGA